MRRKSVEDQLSAFEATIKDLDNYTKSFALEVLVDCDLDVERACYLLDLKLAPCQLSIFHTDLTDFLKTLPPLTTDERKRKIAEITNSWVSESNERIQTKDSEADKLSKWQRDKQQELMMEIEPNQQDVVRELLRDTNFDIHQVREILNLPPLALDDVDPESPEYEALTEFKAILHEGRPQGEHNEALQMLRENKYNVQETCSQIGLCRIKPKPRKRDKQIKFLPKYNKNQQKLPEWPDDEKMVKADYDVQIENHPYIIDLHYYTLQEASECIDRFISYHKKLGTPETFITTGRGVNSASKSTIKKQTIKQLKENNIKFAVHPGNPGQLIVTFS